MIKIKPVLLSNYRRFPANRGQLLGPHELHARWGIRRHRWKCTETPLKMVVLYMKNVLIAEFQLTIVLK